MASAHERYLAPDDVERLLAPAGRGGWQAFNETIMSLPPLALKELIVAEQKGRQRAAVIIRLHGRFTRLRAKAERAALLKGFQVWD